mmetsp:Transcript_36362/g.60735  ORF Transcript_36362/g.60735 Transcript_36362/m.60735 type:complete len:298 (-) Transcript_36362:1920-2813(-)
MARANEGVQGIHRLGQPPHDQSWQQIPPSLLVPLHQHIVCVHFPLMKLVLLNEAAQRQLATDQDRQGLHFGQRMLQTGLAAQVLELLHVANLHAQSTGAEQQSPVPLDPRQHVVISRPLGRWVVVDVHKILAVECLQLLIDHVHKRLPHLHEAVHRAPQGLPSHRGPPPHLLLAPVLQFVQELRVLFRDDVIISWSSFDHPTQRQLGRRVLMEEKVAQVDRVVQYVVSPHSALGSRRPCIVARLQSLHSHEPLLDPKACQGPVRRKISLYNGVLGRLQHRPLAEEGPFRLVEVRKMK